MRSDEDLELTHGFGYDLLRFTSTPHTLIFNPQTTLDFPTKQKINIFSPINFHQIVFPHFRDEVLSYFNNKAGASFYSFFFPPRATLSDLDIRIRAELIRTA